MVAQEQRQWAKARENFLRALETFVGYQESYSVNIVLRSLARLWRASGDESLVTAIASIAGNTPKEVEEVLRTLAAGDEGSEEE